MNMDEQATRPLNWHLWQWRLGWTTEWLDTKHAILSHVGPVSKGIFCLLVVGWLSPSRLCSSDSVGTPPDWGVVYPCDTFQTLGWGDAWQALPVKHSQMALLLLVLGSGGDCTNYPARTSRWIWPQVTPRTYLKGISLNWYEWLVCFLGRLKRVVTLKDRK